MDSRTNQSHRSNVIATAITVLLAIAGSTAFAQQGEDLNIRYAFPASLGVEYQTLTPFASEATGFTAFDVATSIRLPLSTAALPTPA